MCLTRTTQIWLTELADQKKTWLEPKHWQWFVGKVMRHPCSARVSGCTSTSFTSQQASNSASIQWGQRDRLAQGDGQTIQQMTSASHDQRGAKSCRQRTKMGVIVLCSTTNDQHKLQQYDTACNWYSLEVNYLKQSQTVSVSEHARIRHDLPNPCILPKAINLQPKCLTASPRAYSSFICSASLRRGARPRLWGAQMPMWRARCGHGHAKKKWIVKSLHMAYRIPN